MYQIIFLFVFVFLITSLTVHAQTMPKTYGPIKSGDMLWNIAAQVRPNASVNRYQVMIALLKANPQAFEIACNMNSLKVGKRLQIPTLAEMRVLSKTQALAEFNRQLKQWQAYRRQKQAIVCTPPLEKPQVTTPLVKKPSVVKKAPSSPSVTEPVMATASTDFSARTIDNQSKPKIATSQPPPILSEATSSPTKETSNQSVVELLASTGLFMVVSLPLLPTPVPLLAIVSVVLLLFLLLILFVRRWRSSSLRQKTDKVDKKWSDDPLEKMPMNNPNLKTNEETHQTVNAEEATPASASQEEQVPNYTSVALKMKEKLDQVRAYLANDQAQLTDNMLREVLQQGSREQQAEALQLYQISQKIAQTLPTNHNKTYVSLPQVDASNSPIWQDLEQINGHLPTQYLPENQERIFELIDKIFALLDHELNAKGQLIEAYKHRYHPEWIAKNTTEQSINQSEENLFPKSRVAPEPTRHL